jgi:hypothetical protein
MERHESTFTRHEMLHFLQWLQNHLTQHHARLFSPHHAHNEKNGSPKNPKASYKCNVIPQGLKDGKDPNLVCNAVKKTFEAKRKKKMTKHVNNHTFTPGLAHNFKYARCELKGK